MALKGEDMCGDAVQEPAIVADGDRATGKIFQSYFKRAQDGRDSFRRRIEF